MDQERREWLKKKLMEEISLVQMIRGLSGNEYRRLVETHLQRNGSALEPAITNSISLFTPSEKDAAERIIDEFNELGYNKEFWLKDAKQVYIDIQKRFCELMHPEVVEDAIQFNVFQIITMNFAYMAREQKALRKFIGIKKGWFS